jgi:DNA-binding transcriptional MocR family regulator
LPSLKALDEEDRVLYQSTFSKVLCPGLRVGYLVVPPIVLRQLVLAKQGADLHANSFSQYLIDRFIQDGHFASHLEKSRAAYRRRRDAMAVALGQDPSLGIEYSKPHGGFYFWCRFPDGIEQSALLANAAARGVVYLPGRPCFATDPPEHFLRLNFSHATEDSIKVGVERLLDAVREASGEIPLPDADWPTTSPVV